jgi:hypothetical protein
MLYFTYVLLITPLDISKLFFFLKFLIWQTFCFIFRDNITNKKDRIITIFFNNKKSLISFNIKTIILKHFS